jgi:flavin reductase (DIM6/NTAB) family NADH-FMN oxidoreductase RutF
MTEKIEIPLVEWDILHPGLAVYLVSTWDGRGGFNIAPYGMVMPISYHPLMYALSSARDRDTYRNIKETGEFTLNLPSCELLHQVNIAATRFPPEVDEFEKAGLTPIEGIRLRVPRIKECRGHIECKLKRMIDVEERIIILGDVVSLSIDRNAYLKDPSRQKELLSPMFYCHRTYFSLGRYIGDRKV